MKFAYAVRYFRVVAVVPPLFVGGFVVAVAAAAFRLTSDPSAGVEALTPVLLLQLFAASSGYRVPARRGHYDMLLTSCVPRWQVACAHCVASIFPGVLAWLCVVLLEVAASHGAHARTATIGSCVAMAAASLLAWTGAIAVSRATAAVGWLLLLTVPPFARVASPVRLLGSSPAPSLPIVLSLLTLLIVIVVISCTCIVRMSVPLEGSQ